MVLWLLKTLLCIPAFNEGNGIVNLITRSFEFVDKIMSLIPDKQFINPYNKWLDPGTGTGNFSIIL